MNCEIPEEFGGLGLSCLSHCMIQEEIAWACAGVNTSVAANALAALPGDTKHPRHYAISRRAESA